MVVDVGAGDGRFAVETAKACPDTLTIAVDPDHRALRDGVRRAHRARLTNALFVVSSAEALPGPLDGIADAMHVHFPWGSLRTCFGDLALLLRAGGAMTVVLNDVCVSPAVPGLVITEIGYATPAQVSATRSTWAKRLGVGPNRPAWRLVYVKEP